MIEYKGQAEQRIVIAVKIPKNKNTEGSYFVSRKTYELQYCSRCYEKLPRKEQIRRKITKCYQCPNCGKWINERGIMW